MEAGLSRSARQSSKLNIASAVNFMMKNDRVFIWKSGPPRLARSYLKEGRSRLPR